MPSAACSRARVPRRCWGKRGRRGGGRGEAGRRAVTKGESRVWEVERKKVVRMERGAKSQEGGWLGFLLPESAVLKHCVQDGGGDCFTKVSTSSNYTWISNTLLSLRPIASIMGSIAFLSSLCNFQQGPLTHLM